MKNIKTFSDPLNTMVFTTIFVVVENKLITHVFHDADDGAWQFFSNDWVENLEKYAMLVRLDEIIEIDNSVLDVADLPVGYVATRKSENDKWIFQKQE